MLLFNKTLSVVPLTTHIKIKDVSAKIRKSIIIKKVRTINIYYKKIFKKMPKIAVLGLNPHNSELSKSSEEIRKIIPAIKILKKNYKIFGPFAADSFFINQFKNFNVVLGMYHDDMKHIIKESKYPKTLDDGGKVGGFNTLIITDEIYEYFIYEIQLRLILENLQDAVQKIRSKISLLQML